jgi:ferredoxin
MHDGVAVIDQLKCTACQVCIDVCPTGAFQLLETKEPVLTAASRSIEVLEPETIVVTPPENFGKGARILSLLGQYLIPRVVDVLAAYLERWVSSPVQVQNLTTHQTGTYYPYRRRRQRRGRA